MFRRITISILLLCAVTGCNPVVGMLAKAKEQGDERKGITYYVGGAGPIGHVGSWDIPRGLQAAGYEGFVEIVTWQGMSHANDQLNLSRNRTKAAELASEIRSYHRKYPTQKINIIALSAGTGIATFALQYLPEQGVEIDHVIFLGCSLSSTYDLSSALHRVHTGLYCLYSFHDPILKNVVWYTGTVDRSSSSEGIAGMEGFHLPKRKGSDTPRQYRKLFNIPYRSEFADFGYSGLHTDCTNQDFVRNYLAPVILGDEYILIGKAEYKPSARPPATTRPTSRPSLEQVESTKARKRRTSEADR